MTFRDEYIQQEKRHNNAASDASVLLVEDEDALREVYGTILEPMCEITEAKNGEEAVERMSDEVDIVLTDRRMPLMNGAEAIRTIREDGYNPVVVMVTAVNEDVEGVDLDVDEYLLKPVSTSNLRAAVSRATA
jgi:CheY-like chemotaxis protein